MNSVPTILRVVCLAPGVVQLFLPTILRVVCLAPGVVQLFLPFMIVALMGVVDMPCMMNVFKLRNMIQIIMLREFRLQTSCTL